MAATDLTGLEAASASRWRCARCHTTADAAGEIDNAARSSDGWVLARRPDADEGAVAVLLCAACADDLDALPWGTAAASRADRPLPPWSCAGCGRDASFTEVVAWSRAAADMRGIVCPECAR